MVITNFSAGELSQNLKGRVDIGSYYAGVQKMKNFEIIPTGGIQRRVGFKRMGKLAGDARLIPFIVDSNLSFIFECVIPEGSTHAVFRVWKNGEKMLTALNNQVEIDTPYTSLSEINEIQYAQNYDLMFFVQENYRPFTIQYHAGTDTFEYGLFKPKYYTDVYLDDKYGLVSKAADYLPLEANEGDWCIYQGHLWKCIKGSTTTTAAEWEQDGSDPDTDTGLFRDLPEEEESLNAGKYPRAVAFYQNRLYFAGTKNNPQRIWASCTPSTSDTRYNEFGTYRKYVTVGKVIKNPDTHLFTADILLADMTETYTVLRNVSQDLTKEGILTEDIANYFLTQSSFLPMGTKVISITGNTITINKGSRDLAIDEDKHAVVFTLSLWQNADSASADDYEYSVVNSNVVTADCSFYMEPASDQNDAIKWLATGNFLALGTETNVWNIPAGVNAQNVQCTMTGRYGSDNIQAHVVDTAVIFFAQGKCGIREFYYNAQNEAFQTNNIAIMAEQMLFESPAMDFDFCTNPYNKIVITREDGSAVSLLYDKNNGVMGWNRIEHGEGFLRSCAITRGSGYSDYVFFVVKYGTDYYLEKLDLNLQHFLDSWEYYTPGMDLTGYYGDKAVIYNETSHEEWPVNDIENIPEDFIKELDIVTVGYKYDSIVLSMPVVTNDISAKKRIVNLHVRFNNSYMPHLTFTGIKNEKFLGVQEPYSGVKKIDFPGTSDIDVTFMLQISKPEACNILTVDASLSA